MITPLLSDDAPRVPIYTVYGREDDWYYIKQMKWDQIMTCPKPCHTYSTTRGLVTRSASNMDVVQSMLRRLWNKQCQDMHRYNTVTVFASSQPGRFPEQRRCFATSFCQWPARPWRRFQVVTPVTNYLIACKLCALKLSSSSSSKCKAYWYCFPLSLWSMASRSCSLSSLLFVLSSTLCNNSKGTTTDVF